METRESKKNKERKKKRKLERKKVRKKVRKKESKKEIHTVIMEADVVNHTNTKQTCLNSYDIVLTLIGLWFCSTDLRTWGITAGAFKGEKDQEME